MPAVSAVMKAGQASARPPSFQAPMEVMMTACGHSARCTWFASPCRKCSPSATCAHAPHADPQLRRCCSTEPVT